MFAAWTATHSSRPPQLASGTTTATATGGEEAAAADGLLHVQRLLRGLGCAVLHCSFCELIRAI